MNKEKTGVKVARSPTKKEGSSVKPSSAAG